MSCLMKRALMAALLLPLALDQGAAHEGPPFEIIRQDIDPYRISVWADPDIGTAVFFVVLEPRRSADFAAPDSVAVSVQPVIERLEEATYTAEPQPVRYGARYYTEVYFDRGELWNVRVRVFSGATVREVTTQVEATPDGTIGPIGLVLYLLPFLAVGFLWLKAHRRRRAESGR